MAVTALLLNYFSPVFFNFIKMRKSAKEITPNHLLTNLQANQEIRGFI
jgi:hypothetical protein